MPKLSQRLAINLTIGILIPLVAAYLGISAWAAHVLSTPQRHFDPGAKVAFKISPQDVEFVTSDGIKIKAWFAKFKESDRAIILVHGMNSSRSAEFAGHFAEFAAKLQKQGFNVLMIDLRGHGQSGDARFTFGLKERQDVITAVNWLEKQGFKPGKIGVLGVSMGSAAAIGATVEDTDIGALVVDSCFAEVYPVIKLHWYEASGLPEIFLASTLFFGNLLTGTSLISSKPAIEIAKIPPRPLLIIHSILDDYIPVNNAYQLKIADPLAEYWETTATKHPESYLINPEAYTHRVANFFKQNL